MHFAGCALLVWRSHVHGLPSILLDDLHVRAKETLHVCSSGWRHHHDISAYSPPGAVRYSSVLPHARSRSHACRRSVRFRRSARVYQQREAAIRLRGASQDNRQVVAGRILRSGAQGNRRRTGRRAIYRAESRARRAGSVTRRLSSLGFIDFIERGTCRINDVATRRPIKSALLLVLAARRPVKGRPTLFFPARLGKIVHNARGRL